MENSSFLPIVLRNDIGVRLECIPFGATLTRLQLPDRHGNLVDVVVGLNDERNYGTQAYRERNWCLGATVGPFAGRIGNGGFEMDGAFYSLSGKLGVHLHGEEAGWQYRDWAVTMVNQAENLVEFKLNMEAGAGGYPATVEAKVRYELQEDHLRIEYAAISDRPTVLNLTNHAYFNPGGNCSLDALELMIASDKMLRTDQQLVPTGAIDTITDGPYDYRSMRSIETDHPMDHCFVLEKVSPQASIYSTYTGIRLTVETDQPALVVFTPKRLEGVALRDKMESVDYPAICLECQGYPNAPNEPGFPSTRIAPGQPYKQTTRYYFSID